MAAKDAALPRADTGSPATAAGAGPLCDGNARLRFSYSSAGGYIQFAETFFLQYGWAFLHVRGDCHYVADHPHDGELRQGVLTSADAERLQAAVHYDEIGGFGARGDNELAGPCYDASTQTLRTPGAQAACRCCAEPMWTAVRGAMSETHALYDRGRAVAGPVTARASVEPFADADADAGEAPSLLPAWPLDSDIKELLSPAGKRFDDPADARELRQLRTDARANGASPNYGFDVRGPDGTVYTVLVRDELPEDI